MAFLKLWAFTHFHGHPPLPSEHFPSVLVPLPSGHSRLLWYLLLSQPFNGRVLEIQVLFSLYELL